MANDRIIVAYFDDFVDAFRTFSGDRIAAKFAVPYLVKGEAGKSQVFDSQAQVSRYFQGYLDEYRSLGCSQCHYGNLAVTWLGSECALASVEWRLLDSSGGAVIAWSESYLLSVIDQQVLAFASIDHVGVQVSDCEAGQSG